MSSGPIFLWNTHRGNSILWPYFCSLPTVPPTVESLQGPDIWLGALLIVWESELGLHMGHLWRLALLVTSAHKNLSFPNPSSPYFPKHNPRSCNILYLIHIYLVSSTKFSFPHSSYNVGSINHLLSAFHAPGPMLADHGEPWLCLPQDFLLLEVHLFIMEQGM